MNIDGPDREFEIVLSRDADEKSAEIVGAAHEGYRSFVKKPAVIILFLFCTVLPGLPGAFGWTEFNYLSGVLDAAGLSLWILMIHREFRKEYSADIIHIQDAISRKRIRAPRDGRRNQSIGTALVVLVLCVALGHYRTELLFLNEHDSVNAAVILRQFTFTLAQILLFQVLVRLFGIISPLRRYCDHSLILSYPQWLVYHRTLRTSALETGELALGAAAILLARAPLPMPLLRGLCEEGVLLYLLGLVQWRILYKDRLFLTEGLLPNTNIADVFN